MLQAYAMNRAAALCGIAAAVSRRVGRRRASAAFPGFFRVAGVGFETPVQARRMNVTFS